VAAETRHVILPGMFLRYYLDLPMPFEQAERALLAIPGSSLGALVEETGDRAQRLLAEVGFTVAERRIQRQVAIAFRDPNRLETRTLLPMTWDPTSPDGLLPALDGDLEVASLGPNRTQLSISAMYTPPMGTFGRALDRALLHRVAEATVKEFLERVAAGMKERHSAVPPRRMELYANGREKRWTGSRLG
jgi:hypothetical protein